MVGSNLNMILMRQTCGQRSSMAAGSKRRALSRICHMMRISKCRRDVGCRSVHNLGTDENNAAAQCRLQMDFAAKRVF